MVLHAVDGAAELVLRVAASEPATSDDGKLYVAAMTADGTWQWSRTLSPTDTLLVRLVPHVVTSRVVCRATG